MANKNSISGLVLVFIGLLIEIFTSISQNFSYSVVYGTVYTWIGVAGIVISIIGLVQLSKVNRNFAKAKIFYIIDICISVAYAIILIILTAVSGGSIENYVGTIVVSIILGVIFVIAMFVIDLLKIKSLMGGCADVANDNNDSIYAAKCINAWNNFLVSTIIFTAVTIIMLIVQYIPVINVIFAIILIGATIYVIVARIMVLVRTMGTYSRFKNGNISSFSADRKDLMNDIKDDHKDIFNDAKEGMQNFRGNVKEGVKDTATGIADGAKELGGNIKEGVEDFAGGAKKDAKEVGEAVAEGAKNMGEAAADGAKEVGDAFKEGAEKVKDIVDGETPDGDK